MHNNDSNNHKEWHNCSFGYKKNIHAKLQSHGSIKININVLRIPSYTVLTKTNHDWIHYTRLSAVAFHRTVIIITDTCTVYPPIFLYRLLLYNSELQRML